MKRLFVMLTVALLVSSVSSTQATQYGRIGLYADEGHSTNEVWSGGAITQFTFYIFCLPGENGLMCAEYAVDIPANVIINADGIVENPGMSVSLGELLTGMSFCFLECQNDWVWTHSIPSYLMDVSPTQISIVEHPLVGTYQYANCIAPDFPTEPCFYGPPLCLNHSCPLDTDPPGLSGASPQNSTHLLVTFDEEIFAFTAEDIASYHVFKQDDPSDSLDIDYVALQGGGSSVMLQFASPMGALVPFRLEVRNIFDVAGNAIPAGSGVDFLGLDNDPPHLVGASTITLSEVAVLFSEPMAEGPAENTSNYEIYRTELGPGASVPITGAELQADGITVHLSLGEELFASTDYTVRVNNVTDLSGNVISANSMTSLHISDTFPPVVFSILTPDFLLVRAYFNEQLDSVTATDLANYGIVEKFDTLTSLAITSIELFNYTATSSVLLHLADSLQAGTDYLLRLRDIEDHSGNAIPPGTQYDFLYIDATPPEIAAAGALSNTLLEIEYSEEMDPVTAEDVSNYEVFEKADTANVFAVTDAALQGDARRVHLTLGEPIEEGVTYTVRVSNVRDLAENEIVPGSTVDVVIPDTTPPGLVAVTVLNATTCDVEFTERVDEGTAEDPANYWLFATADPADSIPVAGAERLEDEKTVRLSLGLPLTFGISYTLQVYAVCDISGNPIPPGSEIVFTAEDTYPPEIMSVGASAHSIVEVEFSEEVEPVTAETPVNYKVWETGNPTVSIEATAAALQGDGVTVLVTLVGSMTERVDYTLRVGNVEDLSGNPIDPPALYYFTMPDITPPEIVSAIALSSMTAKVVFNEQIDEATANEVTHYQIYLTSNPSSTVPIVSAALHPNGTDVHLSLGNPLTPDVEYTVSVSDVDDIWGNTILPGSTVTFTYVGFAGGCIGLYSDDQHSNWCVDGVGFYPVEMWVWCHPSDNGLICAEFAVSFPPNTITSTITWNPDITPVIGDIWTGVSVCFNNCYYDWVWPLHETIYVVDPVPSVIEVIPYPEYGLHFANCFPGYPLEEAGVCTNLYINCTDMIPPELVSAESSDPLLVTANFSEQITSSSATNLSNYELFETADPGNTFTIADAALSGGGTSVELTLESPLTYGESYTLRVSGVEDLSGNEIAPGSEAEFVPQNEPPALASAEGVSHTEIDVLFTEQVDPVTAGDAANYEVYATEDTTDIYGVTGALLQGDGVTVRLAVDRALTVGTGYTVRVNDVEDLHGLAVAPGSTVQFVMEDIFPPELVSVDVVDLDEIEVHFSEILQTASAEDVSNYVLHETVEPSNVIAILAADYPPGETTVRLFLDAPLAYEVSYTLHVSGVADAAGNPMPPDDIEFIPEDIFPPQLVDAVVLSDFIVDAYFDETLDPATAEDAGNYELFELDDSLITLSIMDAELDTSGAVVRLALGDPVLSAVSYVLRVNNVEDLAGNPVAPNSEVIIYESDPPGLVSVTQEDMQRLLVVFDEPVRSTEAQDVSSYQLHVTGEPSNNVVIYGAGLLPDGVTVRLTAHAALVHGTSYTLHADGVKDLVGNPVPPGSTLEFIAADTYPPQLISVTPEDAHTVRIYFNEEVEQVSAETVSNYEIFETGDPSNTVPVTGAVLLSNGISVRLTLGDDLETGIEHTLRVSNVEDIAGNPIAEGTEVSFMHFGPSSIGFIGLYTDVDHSQCEVWSEGGFVPFTYYIWCLPSSNGMICAEFATDASPNIIRSTVTANTPIISVSLGDIAGGMSVCFNTCHTDWTWSHQQQCYLTSTDVGYIQITPHPDVGVHQFANCLPGYPTEPAYISSRIYINEDSTPVAVLLESFSASLKPAGIEVTWRLIEIEEEIEFFVLRAVGESDEFIELASPRIERSDLAFTFTDELYEAGETYRYRVEYRIDDERRLLFETGPVATPEMPLTLYQNMPNPFNPTTSIRYYLPAATHVVLEIYDVSGRRVACPVNRHQTEGYHLVEWNGIDDTGVAVSSGVYFYRLIADRQTLSRKMVLLR